MRTSTSKAHSFAVTEFSSGGCDKSAPEKATHFLELKLPKLLADHSQQKNCSSSNCSHPNDKSAAQTNTIWPWIFDGLQADSVKKGIKCKVEKPYGRVPESHRNSKRRIGRKVGGKGWGREEQRRRHRRICFASKVNRRLWTLA